MYPFVSIENSLNLGKSVGILALNMGTGKQRNIQEEGSLGVSQCINAAFYFLHRGIAIGHQDLLEAIQYFCVK